MELKQILEQLEETTNNPEKRFHSFFYQPERLIINTNDATIKTFNTNSTSFNKISFNLAKPCISVKSIQLLNINVPLTTSTSFNDYELVFPYYKLKTKRNFDDTYTIIEEPNLSNMYYVRLLPSYYPVNIIPNSQNYGFNKTFANYQELSDELAKSCAYDLAYTNSGISPSVPFIPNDVLISYNESENKFQMTGNNVNTSWAIAWSSATAYEVNDIVSLGGVYYIAKEPNTNSIPTSNPLNWALYTSNIWNTYLIAGYDDPNTQQMMEIVNIDSGLFDFNYSVLYGLNDIVDIPPQPYFEGSTYTLSRRLGFNWNGVFIWPNQVNQFVYTFGDGSALLYNRLRPIPRYEFLPEELGVIPIPNNNPYTATTYIADGFCNLVLTSMIYLYANFIGTSTFSSSNNNNIIGIIPINCNTLGISFISEFLDNPMTKVNNTIQDIQLEFRNEHNQPIYFGNNGIITFSFKILY